MIKIEQRGTDQGGGRNYREKEKQLKNKKGEQANKMEKERGQNN